MFPGQRYGLSATVSREDGTEVIYNYHVGDPFYKDLMQTVKPNIRFRQTPFLIPEDDYIKIITDKSGNPNVSKLRVYVGQMPDRNEYIALDLLDAVAAGRKVLALSHSKEQLKLLYEKFQALKVDCGICTGDQKVAERWRALRERQVIFGTHQLVMEAIDEDSLDTLVWLTPFGSNHPDGGKNALQQGMGRIQGYRFREGMKHPLVVIFDDVYIRQFHKMCNKLRLQMRRWPTDEGGPYEYLSLKSRTTSGAGE
jgi:superfamily II DNA or RNA helicase